MAGHDENRNRAHAHEPAQELDAVDAGQLDVEGNHVDRHGGVLEDLPRLLRALGGTDESEAFGFAPIAPMSRRIVRKSSMMKTR